MSKKIKRIGCVVSGWHYPGHFYESIASQKLPKGWELEIFVISHRDPIHSYEEKKSKVLDDTKRGTLDKILYRYIISKEEIEKLGIKYIEKPNTIGDWGNSNQWLDEHNYNDYDLLLFTHDDNFILNENWIKDIIKDKAYKEWEILANSVGMPAGMIRGSCEFFKPSFLKKIGGKFDLSEVTLNRVGETTATEDTSQLYDWNSTVYPLMRFINSNNIKVGYLSPAYRVSAYVIEGERGYISNTHGANTEQEEKGLKFLEEHKII